MKITFSVKVSKRQFSPESVWTFKQHEEEMRTEEENVWKSGWSSLNLKLIFVP